jgi:hypothetical protein
MNPGITITDCPKPDDPAAAAGPNAAANRINAKDKLSRANILSGGGKNSSDAGTEYCMTVLYV